MVAVNIRPEKGQGVDMGHSKIIAVMRNKGHDFSATGGYRPTLAIDAHGLNRLHEESEIR